MLQTISFSLYLTVGAVVFSEIEGWEFVDGLYWADYTLLTIGLGTDFPLTKTLARMLLIPYAAIGITLIGLVVTSVRALVLERVKTKVVRRRLGKERERWKENIQERRRLAAWREMSLQSNESSQPPSINRSIFRVKSLYRFPQELEKHTAQVVGEGRQPPWHRAEFELMRFLEARSKNVEKYTSLGVSFLVILIVWFFGSVIFWICEHVCGYSRFITYLLPHLLILSETWWMDVPSVYLLYLHHAVNNWIWRLLSEFPLWKALLRHMELGGHTCDDGSHIKYGRHCSRMGRGCHGVGV